MADPTSNRSSRPTRSSATSRKRRSQLPVPLWIVGVLSALILAVVVLLIAWPVPQEKREDAVESDRSARPRSQSNQTPPVENPRDVPLRNRERAVCRLYTPDPGFFVLVDDQPALDEAGEWLQTPCELIITQGTHRIRVVQEGFQDQVRELFLADDSEFFFDPEPASEDEETSLLQAPLFALETGEPVELASLNSSGQELDPYITADGLSIWFAGNRREGRGVYVATRPSVYHQFDAPTFLQATRGSDVPATPSLTTDFKSLVYVIPNKARIWSQQRHSPLTEFEERAALQFNRQGTVNWPSSQILGDGLRLYWTEQADDGTLKSKASIRSALDEPFRHQLDFTLPGKHPCLSSDGLRQYAFDGTTLWRARRGALRDHFSEPEEIATLELPNYAPSPNHRQYFVSDDEQWLFYCADPARDANLYVVRLHAGSGWGYVPQGKPIPQKQLVAVTSDDDSEENAAEMMPDEEPVDPRSLPLPYAVHWETLTALLAERRYDEADELLRSAEQDASLTSAEQFAKWDREEVEQVSRFWADVREAVENLEPGDSLRVGSARLEFQRFEEGVIFGKVSTAEVSKPLMEMTPIDLVALADRVIDRDDSAGQYRIGLFLFHDSKGTSRSATTRMERASALKEEFWNRRWERRLFLAEREFERDNLAAGLKLAQEVIEQAPGTPLAERARSMEQELYRRSTWSRVGSRQWEISEAEGAYQAALQRSPGSFLASPREYENFELHLEWKTTGPTGQGGVYFRYPGQGDPYENAFKIHLANDYGLDPDPYCTGALFGVQEPEENAVRRAGEWNSLQVQVKNQWVTVTVNGKQVLETLAQDPEVPKQGLILLDGVTGGITYRKMLLMELPAGR